MKPFYPEVGVSFIITAFILISGNLSAQDGVLIDYVGTTRDNSAVLDVRSTNQGVMVPRVNLSATNVTAPISAPATSLLVYNTASTGSGPTDVQPGYYYWSGTGWARLMSGNTTPLTGSGAANKVAFWSSATDLSQNTDFHWDNTNIRLGIGTDIPTNPLTIGSNINHDASFDYSEAVTTIFENANNNGGNSPNGTRDILNLVREGISGQAYGNKATFALGRYENSGVNSRSQLDIKLTDNNFSLHNTIMSLRSDGNVGIGITGPNQLLDVAGDINSSTGYRIGNTAASGQYLRGNGTKFVSSGIQVGDLPSHTHPWSQVTSKPSAWLDATNLIETDADFNNSVPSGFYQQHNGANAPTSGTWYNMINVRHSNTGNDHGFQIAASYYDENIWTRTYSGGSGSNDGTFTTWRSLLHSGNLGSNAILNQTASDQAAGFRIDGDGIFNGGSVGIGTVSPLADLQVRGGKTYLNKLATNPQTSNYANADLVIGDNTSTRNGYGGTNGSHIFLQSSAKSSITALDESNNLGQISYENLKWTIGESVGSWGTQAVQFPNYTNGMLGVNASGDIQTRSIAGTTNQLEVTNGNGVSGNPTLNISNCYTADLKANANMTGGGTVSWISDELKWSQRFIIISNGRGSHFSTNGYFDISMPPVGTVIPGLGGASDATVTGTGIPIVTWGALYYILPIGSSNGSLDANFRIVRHTANVVVPETWVLVAVHNGDSGNRSVRLGTGVILAPGQTITPTTSYIEDQTASDQSAGFRIDGNGIFNGGDVVIGNTSATANLDVAGDVKLNRGNSIQKRHIFTIDRSVAQAAGSYVMLGTISSNGKGTYVNIHESHHNGCTINSATFNIQDVYYAGTTTDWMQVPTTNYRSYSGSQDFAIDVRRTANHGSANLEIRFRSLGGACATTVGYFEIQTNGTFTASTTSGSGATVAGYLGSTGYQFPVSNNRFAASEDGVFIENTGEVGIGTSSPNAKLDVHGDFHIDGAKPIIMRRYTGLGDNVNYSTGVSSNTYNAAIIGFGTQDVDIQENGDGDFIKLFMHTNGGTTWHIGADLRSHNDNESWYVDVMYVNTQMSTRDGGSWTSSPF